MDGIKADEFAQLLNYDRVAKPQFSLEGKVSSIESDGTLNVISGYVYDDETQTAQPLTMACVPYCDAKVDDVVFVHVYNGRAIALNERYRGDRYLPVSGGEITGKLIRKSDTLDLTKADNNLSTYWNPVAFHIQDKNDLAMGYLQWYAHNTGYTYVALDARNNVEGTQVINQLVIRVDKDGTRKVSVTSPAAWRTALELGTMSSEAASDYSKKPTTLYNNSSGTTGTVTLSQSAANFDHIRIAFGYPTDSVYQSITVCNPNGKYTQLCIPETSGSNGWVIGRNVYISGTSIATRGNWYGEGRVNDSYGWSNTNGTSIYKVEGWNG